MKDVQKTTKPDRFYWAVTKHRISALVLLLIITTIFLYGAFQIRGQVQLAAMFPYDHPYLKLSFQFSRIFGSGASGAVIAIQVKEGDIFNTAFLNKLKKMTMEVELWEEVHRGLTKSIASLGSKAVMARAKGEISVTPLYFNKTPETAQEMDLLKKRIYMSPSYRGTMVSEDGTAALLVTEFRETVPYSLVHQKLQQLVKDYSDANSSVHIVGFPSLMGWIYSLKGQILFIFFLSILAMIVVLVLIFRGNPVGMIAVMSNAFILTVWGLGFIGFTGINFNPLLYVVAFLICARMIGNAQQITYRYFEELDSSKGDKKLACYETMRTMWLPNVTAVATDVAGFAVLFAAKIILMQQLAIIMSFWMATISLTGFLVPVIASLLRWKVNTGAWKKETCQNDGLARAIMSITNHSIRSRSSRWVVGGGILLVAVGAVIQIGELKIGDPTPGSPILFPDHAYNQDQRIINEKFDRSSESLVLYYQGEPESACDPAVLNTFEDFGRYMKERLPDIYKSSLSLNDVIKAVNTIWHDADEVWDQLPMQDNVMRFCISYVTQSMGVQYLARFIDEKKQSGQTILFFADHTSDNLLRIRDAAYAFFKTHPMKVEKGEFKLAGGRIGMEIALNESMKRYHLLIDLMIYSALFVIMTLLFRSFVAGIMLTVPLILSNSLAAAYMALTGMGLSINTLPVFAIGAGVGIDFAIYLYSRAIEEFPIQGGDWKNTITQSICTCGKAVFYTALTIILPIIPWYFFSDLKFQSDVGFFLAIILSANAILTITLHPLMLYVIKPKFIRRAELKSSALMEGGATIGISR
ncbi:MAG: MMPL family transporter [Desulfatitalea sp.]|nr:MMPL family transporter [Desulfatitalea sp.]NNK02160.1 MMPL family transporter [Desulfatitalea sp.]